jgi:hypothetical protein
MPDLIQKTLKEIEEKNIAPKPKWQHNLRDYAFWAFFVISIIIGALATSTIIYLLASHDWDVHEYLNKSLLEDIFSSLPYLWIAILSVLIIFAFSQFQKTKSGYRHSPYIIVGTSVISSLLLGVMFFYSFSDLGIHDFLSKRVPIYNSLVCSETTVWNNIGSGLLNGEVIAIKNNNEFTLRDCNGKIWEVQYDESQGLKKMPLMTGMKIKMVGMQEGDNIFRAKVIRPLDKLRKQINLRRDKVFQLS